MSEWRVGGNLAAKWDYDTEKLRVSVLRYAIICAIVYQNVNMCLGKLGLPAASSSAVMLGSAAWILHKACFTAVPNLQSDLHQNSCRGLVKIAWAYFCIYICNSMGVFFLFCFALLCFNGERGNNQLQLRFRCALNHSLSPDHWALFQRTEWLSQISLWYIWSMWGFSEQSCTDKIIHFILIGRVVYTWSLAHFPLLKECISIPDYSSGQNPSALVANLL